MLRYSKESYICEWRLKCNDITNNKYILSREGTDINTEISISEIKPYYSTNSMVLTEEYKMIHHQASYCNLEIMQLHTAQFINNNHLSNLHENRVRSKLHELNISIKNSNQSMNGSIDNDMSEMILFVPTLNDSIAVIEWKNKTIINNISHENTLHGTLMVIRLNPCSSFKYVNKNMFYNEFEFSNNSNKNQIISFVNLFAGYEDGSLIQIEYNWKSNSFVILRIINTDLQPSNSILYTMNQYYVLSIIYYFSHSHGMQVWIDFSL